MNANKTSGVHNEETGEVIFVLKILVNRLRVHFVFGDTVFISEQFG